MRKIVARRVYVYRRSNGREPFYEWLASLDKVPMNRVERRIRQCYAGNLGDYKKLQNRLCELKMPFGACYRVYFIESNNDILILCGGSKATQQKDIELAMKYHNESVKEDYYEI